MLVDMEKSYVTAGFFRHTTHHRYQRIKQQDQMRAAMQAKVPGQPEQKGAVGAVKQTAAKFFPSFGPAAGAPAAGTTPPGTPPPNGVPADDDSDDGKSPPKTGTLSGALVLWCGRGGVCKKQARGKMRAALRVGS